MTNQQESFPDLMQDDSFEVVMRGYSRRQVHDYMIRSRNQIRDLEERLARAIDQAEQGRIELAEARRRMVEAPQSYEDLSPRLAQILKLGEEEAAAKREDAENEATRLRDDATTEAERLVGSAKEQSEGILSAAQAEAERRVGEATAAAERMLAQSQAQAEETVSTARAEAEEKVRTAQAEAERVLKAARSESEQTIGAARAEADATLGAARSEAESTLTSARSEAESTLTSAQGRASALDEQTGRRVAYLTDTHGEVMRRLNEIGSVLGDLLHQESAAGPLVNEAQVLPPPPMRELTEPRDALPESADDPHRLVEPRDAADPDVEVVRVIVDADEANRGAGRPSERDGDLETDSDDRPGRGDHDAEADGVPDSFAPSQRDRG
ncbi:hypothetical protein [Spongiactinospora sp. TRM90649]|uniref:hypothetical protein n=1 Tax=Spongiactinospora sp. TRM90649 TaxID=3031114 RepID=UPI0023F6CCCA|nr:hypothetical protein [Spongiactinospora sp. TRM90649]MDF5759292.1 hypothetical protein [Spongiactinospora sp. TRM90649]